ncbi:MAG: triose-phosphate isomerase [Candidatus Cloacimonas sp.]|jgi:triosephosphate isomerase|nr:triose-phosphate isomerase [Candidatus Cloacimonas sp.]
MRKIYIAGNWKMNKGLAETREFVKTVVSGLESYACGRVVPLIAPAYPFLVEALRESFGSALQIAAQDISLHDAGAFTGEVSCTMLASLGLKHCIIGHSERRQYHGETDEEVRLKMQMLFTQNILPIVCIGETLAQRDAGSTKEVIISQLKGCMKDIELATGEEIVLAYEPVWAIGTGRTASPEQAQEVHALIRNWLRENYSPTVAANLPILYGGSVKPDNLASLLACADIDGGLIGGASLKQEDFLKMVEIGIKLR